MRAAAAQSYLDEPLPLHRSNGDEERYPDKRASFTKTLPHDEAGEVDAEAFATFVSVLSSGDPSGFETIPRDRDAETDLNDPQATFAFDLVGLDSASTSLELLAITDAGRAFPGIRIKSTRCGGRHGSERFHRATEVGRGEANAGDGIPWGNAGRRH